MKIKLNRACQLNGMPFSKGQILVDGIVDRWIMDHLVEIGFASEVVDKPKRIKKESKEALDG